MKANKGVNIRRYEDWAIVIFSIDITISVHIATQTKPR